MPPDDGTSTLPVEGEDDVMASADLAEGVLGVLTTQLMQSGNIAQNNFITVQKVVDYDYLENKRMVTLDEAVGIREVASKQVPAGPTSPG